MSLCLHIPPGFSWCWRLVCEIIQGQFSMWVINPPLPSSNCMPALLQTPVRYPHPPVPTTLSSEGLWLSLSSCCSFCSSSSDTIWSGTKVRGIKRTWVVGEISQGRTDSKRASDRALRLSLRLLEKEVYSQHMWCQCYDHWATATPQSSLITW